MATVAQHERGVLPWPLARRAVAGLVQPGGRAMALRALEGVELAAGDRVVELAPGLGRTSALLLDRGPRTWVGVEPDPLAREHLDRALGAPGRRLVDAPLSETGLQDGSATVVVLDALLATLDAGGRAAVLAEAARLLRAGGRLALHEPAPAPGADDPETLAPLRAAGVWAMPVEGLRAEARAAGLIPTGSLVGRLDPPAPRGLMREAGARTALRITRELAREPSLRAAALASRAALEQAALSLRAAIVVAEKPLVLGLRRPRRP